MDDAKRVAMYREQAEADQRQIAELKKENDRLTSLLEHHQQTSNNRYVYIQHLSERNNRLMFALQVINDCLFGNTHDDPILQEAYDTAHEALAPKVTA